MRIGIDARELCGHATGVGRYLTGLLAEWAGQSASHEFILYAHDEVGVRLDRHRFATRLVRGNGDTWWEQVAVPGAARSDHLDVWFAPGYTSPLRLAIPRVVAIHDISFVAHPEWFTLREGMRRRWLVSRSALAAAAVITISQFSRGELIERLGVPADKIHVVPPGVQVRSPSPRVAISPGAVSVLYVGSIFNRRHVPELIRGFATVARDHAAVSLNLVGDNRSYPRLDIDAAIAAAGAAGRIHWHAYVDDAELERLYREARAFAFLSEYEGLGLTPLEALAAGVPPVLLDTPIARESCGGAASYVPAPDPKMIARAVTSALFDDAVRGEILEAAPWQLAKYSWPRAARDTLAVIEAAAR